MAYRRRRYGLADVITGPVAASSTGGSAGPGPSSAPAGWWVNPSNPSQYLPQDQAAKIGSYCLSGPTIGKYDVGGNYGNSVLFCKSLSCQEGLLINGGIGIAIFLLAPGDFKWLGLVPAGWGALGCLFGGIT